MRTLSQEATMCALFLACASARAEDPWLRSAREYARGDKDVIAGQQSGRNPAAVRDAAAAALRAGPRPTPQQIENALRSTDASKQAAAAAALMLLRVDDQRLTDVALERISLGTFWERYYCMRYLGGIGADRLRPHTAKIVQMFRQATPGDELTVNGIDILNGIDLAEAIPLYADLLAAPQPPLWAWVYSRVRERGPEAVSRLVRELEGRRANEALRFVREYEAGLKGH